MNPICKEGCVMNVCVKCNSIFECIHEPCKCSEKNDYWIEEEKRLIEKLTNFENQKNEDKFNYFSALHEQFLKDKQHHEEEIKGSIDKQDIELADNVKFYEQKLKDLKEKITKIILEHKDCKNFHRIQNKESPNNFYIYTCLYIVLQEIEKVFDEKD